MAGRAGCILEWLCAKANTQAPQGRGQRDAGGTAGSELRRRPNQAHFCRLIVAWKGLGGGSGTSLRYHRHKGHTIQAMHMRKRLSGSGCTCSQSMAPWQADQPTHQTIRRYSSRWRTYAPESRSECVRDGGADADFAASRSRTSGDEGVSPGLRSSQLFVVTT